MPYPLQITFRDIPHSDAVDAHVRRRAAKLDRLFDRIVSGRVVVEVPHRRHQHGKRYNVRIDLGVPHTELVVDRQHADELSSEDMHAAVDASFDEMERALTSYVERLHREVKPRNGSPHGVVTKLFPQEGYGFLEAPDGHEIYFHKNAVLGHRFDRLARGTEVRYFEELGDKGPQASTVDIVGRL